MKNNLFSKNIYDWEQIFKNKSEQELLKIIKDNLTYTEYATLTAIDIFKSKGYQNKIVDQIDLKIRERVLRKRRVKSIKIENEYSFGFIEMEKQKTFVRNIGIKKFQETVERVLYDTKWEILTQGEKYFSFRNKQNWEIHNNDSYTIIDVWINHNEINCKAYCYKTYCICDFGYLNRIIMTFIHFFDDIFDAKK